MNRDIEDIKRQVAELKASGVDTCQLDLLLVRYEYTAELHEVLLTLKQSLDKTRHTH